jgi:hypothetical protein
MLPFMRPMLVSSPLTVNKSEFYNKLMALSANVTLPRFSTKGPKTVVVNSVKNS